MEPLAFPSKPSPDAAADAGHAGAPASLRQVAVAMKPEPLTLAALFEAEESPLLRFALGLVGRRSVAEELVQETFLRLHQVWEQVENPRAWLYRSLRNLALNHLRDHPQEAELTEENAPSSPAETQPAESLGRMEAVGVVRMLLAELPEDDRTLIRLKYDDDLRYQEISRRTGLSVGNVGYRLHHLLKGLADSLRRAGVEGSRG
jgi:RNA polymerase sigma factor (sigma-70 family)